LKADVRHSFGHQMVVQDAAIIAPDPAGRTRINWNQWRGDKVIYRRVTPEQINWALLPEVVVLLEPIIGERIVYNPFAGSASSRTEAESRERVGQIWRELYGREADVVRRAEPLSQILDSISAALRAKGYRQEAERMAGLVPRTRLLEQNRLEPQESRRTRNEVRQGLSMIQRRDEKGQLIPYLRPMSPFALEERQLSAVPFLLIEDLNLLNSAHQVDRSAWKSGPSTRDQGKRRVEHVGAEPLIVYMDDIGVAVRDALPQACIFDNEDHPERPPYIWWNSLKDLTFSKFLHASNQAFYLRRYARRVASLWEKEYARRPIVRASSLVSLNRRPHQQLVDPNADLASVPVRWFGHNEWIRDLEMRRIPREELTKRPGYWIGARESGGP
jgi:hypothetical protein